MQSCNEVTLLIVSTLKKQYNYFLFVKFSKIILYIFRCNPARYRMCLHLYKLNFKSQSTVLCHIDCYLGTVIGCLQVKQLELDPDL